MRPVSLTMTFAQKPKKIPECGSQQCRGTGDEEQLTGHDPKLPEHDEGTSNSSRGHLGRVDGNGGVLCTDTDTHDEARSEQPLPRLCESRTDRAGSEAASGKENLASSAEIVVEWIDDEGASIHKVNLRHTHTRENGEGEART